jgi:diguanylate cyclase (GGDEF)-like protein/PAS domain S-box-containing protein
MNIWVFIPLASFLSLLIVGVYIFSMDTQQPVNRLFGALCLNMSLWTFGQFMYRQAGSAELALAWTRGTLPLIILGTVLIFQFTLVFTGSASRLRHRSLFSLNLLIAAGIYFVGALTDLMVRGVVRMPWGYAWLPNTNSWFYWLSNGWGILLIFTAIVMLGRFYLRSTGQPKKRTQFVLLGLGSIFVIGMVEISLKQVGSEVPELTSLAMVGFAGMTAYAIARYRLFALNPAAVADNIVATMTDALILIDRQGKILTINKATQDLLGFGQKELLGLSAEGLFAERKTWDDVSSKLLAGDEPLRNYETRYQTKSSEPIEVLFSGSTVTDDEGQIAGIVAIAKDITERKRAEDIIKHMAYHDGLTGLPNRRLLSDRLKQALLHAKRNQNAVVFLYLDLDRFKQVNDEFGHDVGDLLLTAVGERLTGCLRASDTVARIGGDEFNILLTDISRTPDALPVVEKILEALARPFVLAGREIAVSASIGGSAYPETGDDLRGLETKADLAMRRAKSEGGNIYRFFSEALEATSRRRLTLGRELRQALERHEFLLHYQPIVDVPGAQRIVGAEALVRWAHPERGLLYPADFLEIAEETGLVFPMGEWVLRQACAQNRAWSDAGFSLFVPVNFSTKQFRRTDLDTIVGDAVRQSGLDPARLELELTENAIMTSVESTAQTLIKLKKLGARIALDDFGAGYSSLRDLKQFPIDEIKISRSFIQDMLTAQDSQVIVTAILSLAKNLNLETIAVGVETKEQMEFLLAQNVTVMQGFLFSPPLPAQEFERLLQENRGRLGPAA